MTRLARRRRVVTDENRLGAIAEVGLDPEACALGEDELSVSSESVVELLRN